MCIYGLRVGISNLTIAKLGKKFVEFLVEARMVRGECNRLGKAIPILGCCRPYEGGHDGRKNINELYTSLTQVDAIAKQA